MKQLQFLFFLIILCGCNESTSAQDTAKPINTSINIPFKLTFRKLEEITNASIGNLIFSDTSHTDNDNDQLKCTVLKSGKITISAAAPNTLKIDVPLKVWIEKGVGAFGYYTYNHTTFQMVMSFSMSYQITPDWKLKTQTTKNGYVWIQKPALEIKSIQIPITTIVEKILDKQQQSYALTIDKQIALNLNIKKNIVELWNKIKTPSILSEEYKTWMRITPQSIEAALFIQDATAIQSTFRFNVVSETFIGAQPSYTMSTNVPNLRYIKNVPTDFDLMTSIYIPSTEATEIMKKKFVNQEFEFNEGKYKIKLLDIKIQNEANKMMIEATTEGSYKGSIFIEGIPTYVDSLGKIKLSNIELSLKTKNLLFKTAGWLFNNKLEKKLEENFEIPIKDKLEEARISANTSLTQNKNGVNIRSNFISMKPREIIVMPNQMLINISAKGQLSVEM
jgi:hypothetical protein